MQEGSRVALVHDFLVDVRGAERVFLALCDLFPQADLFTAVYDEEGTEGRFAHRTLHTSYLQRLRPSARTFRTLLPLYPAAMESLDLRGYDLVISSSSAWAHGVIPDEDAVHVCYCHNPFRYAWNARQETLAARGPLGRAALGAVFQRWRQWDWIAAQRVDAYVANSQTTKRRVARYFGREATVLHPPVDVERFTPATPGDAYVVLSELMPHKRIEVAVRAFNELRLPLLVVGNGPDARRLHRMAGPTVSFTGRVSDAEAARILARAQALVVTATEEFGIAAVEAQAAGRPVIALHEGGLRETVIDGETGTFFDAPEPEALAEAVLAFDALAVDPAACVASARRFDTAQFRRGLRSVVDVALDGLGSRRGGPAPAATPLPRPGAPGVSRREVAAGALLALGAAALSAFTILRGYGPHDEGLMLAWARRIADGQWPYRDFWSNYAPGQPLLLAALVKLFGPSLLWWRIVRVAIDATVSVLAFAYVRRHAGTGWALGAWVAVAGAMAWPSGPGPNAPALALALGALLLARRAPLGAGALAGLAVFVRPEIGVAAALGAMLEARGSAGGEPRRRGAARIAVAALVVAVLAFAPFAIVAGGDMADQVLGFASKQDLQRLPFPLDYDGGFDPNKLLEFYLPAILVAGSALWAGWALVRRDGFALAPLVAVGLRLPARAHRRVPPRAAVGRPGHRAGVRGRPRGARAAARGARGGARARRAARPGAAGRAGAAPAGAGGDPGAGGRRRAHDSGRRRRVARPDPVRPGPRARPRAGARRPAAL